MERDLEIGEEKIWESISRLRKPYLAALDGQWDVMKSFYEENREQLCSQMTVAEDTAFHIAAYSEKAELLQCFVDLVEPPSDLFNALNKKNKHDTAIWLLEKDKELAEKKEQNGLTCLHLLANMPHVFSSYSEFSHMSKLKKFPYYCMSQRCRAIWRVIAKGLYCIGLRAIDKLWKMKRMHSLASELTESLVEADYTWKDFPCEVIDDKTISLVKVDASVDKGRGEQGQTSGTKEVGGEGTSKGHQKYYHPLLDAASNGIVEIFDKMIESYPQTYYGRESREQAVGPAFQLQEELRWLKHVRKIIPSHYIMHCNNKGKTADELFQDTHAGLLGLAQKWIKETSQSCSAVSVLVATVVFAAAYTVPGGNDASGRPNFINSPFFVLFTIMDVVSLACSLSSVVMFLSILSSPFEYENFRTSLPQRLMIGFTLLFFSVTTTMLSFAATIFLLLRFQKKAWTNTLIYTAAFLPVSMFALTQFPFSSVTPIPTVATTSRRKKPRPVKYDDENQTIFTGRNSPFRLQLRQRWISQQKWKRRRRTRDLQLKMVEFRTN
nr:ankyrin repeat-containing protein itn1 [Quercus suber]